MPLPSDPEILPPPRPHPGPRHALAASGLCWAGFALVSWLIHTGSLASIDRAGLLFWRDPDLQPRGPAWLLEGARDLTSLGGVTLRNLLALGAIAALLFMRLRREAVMLMITIIGGWLIDEAIKQAASRARPQIVPHLTPVNGPSFPSGHSFNSAVVYISVALVFATTSSRIGVRIALIAAAIVISITVAGTRIWLGVHWPSDCLAGWLGGTGWAFLAFAVLSRGPTTSDVRSWAIR
jgi:undecaprenyl-diphosphatase